jgi:hypothetical protein
MCTCWTCTKCTLYAGAYGDMNSDSIVQGRQLLAKPRMPQCLPNPMLSGLSSQTDSVHPSLACDMRRCQHQCIKSASPKHGNLLILEHTVLPTAVARHRFMVKHLISQGGLEEVKSYSDVHAHVQRRLGPLGPRRRQPSPELRPPRRLGHPRHPPQAATCLPHPVSPFTTCQQRQPCCLLTPPAACPAAVSLICKACYLNRCFTSEGALTMGCMKHGMNVHQASKPTRKLPFPWLLQDRCHNFPPCPTAAEGTR